MNVIVSIIVPVFNAGKTLCETLDSILIQSYPYWEAICVDDGSTDDSVSILMRYCEKDNRFRLIERTCSEKGGSVCRNIGAYSANGEFLIFLDSDDVLAATCLESRIKAIKQTDFNFVVFPMGYFNTSIFDYRTNNNCNSKNHLYRFAALSPSWQTMQPIIRTSFFHKLNGFDITFQRNQDVEFYFRAIIESSNKFLYVNNSDPDCYYRIGGASGIITTEKCKIQLVSALKFLDLVINNQMYLSDKRKFFFCILSIICILWLHSYQLYKEGVLESTSSIDAAMERLKNSPFYKNRMLSYISGLGFTSFNFIVMKIIIKSIDLFLDYDLINNK